MDLQEDGYYWIRERLDPDEWVIAQFSDGLWWHIGGDDPTQNLNGEILEIGEQIIKP